MRRTLCIAPGALLLWMVPLSAADDPAYRLVEFETASFPKVTAVIDSRSGPTNQAAFKASDFGLLEDGKATTNALKTVKFRDTETALALIVAIDVSRSMEGRPLQAIRDGLVQLVSRKRQNDRVAVLSFADDAKWETRWDVSASEMQNTFQNLRTRGNQTRLYDAVGGAMDEFAAQAKQDAGFPNRRCVLVLSDGHDEGSLSTLGQVVKRMKQSRIRLDAVGVSHSTVWLGSLQTLAHEGFGEFRSASTPATLTTLLGQGIDALLDVPTLEFEVSERFGDGRSHQLGVEHLPSHWREELTVRYPERPWYTNRKWQVGSGAALLVLASAAVLFRKRKTERRTTLATSAMQPAAPATARARSETVLESAPHRPSPSARAATEMEPVRRPSEQRGSPAPSWPAILVKPPVDQEIPVSGKAARVATTFTPQPEAGSRPAALIVELGPHIGQRVPLAVEEFWIGSSANNHLCLDGDQAVSGNHACIRRAGQFLRLYDNGSLNNTLVNGRGIGSEVVLLQTGDRIRIGQSELRLEL